MRSIQLERRVQIMIECRYRPSVAVMTLATIIAKSVLMRIVDFMTIDTANSGIVEPVT